MFGSLKKFYYIEHMKNKTTFEELLKTKFILNSKDHTRLYKNYIYYYADEFILNFKINPFKCNCCGIDHLIIELHHKNSNPYDSRPSNLEFLCPNCHSETEGYKNKKNNTLEEKIKLYKSNPNNKLLINKNNMKTNNKNQNDFHFYKIDNGYVYRGIKFFNQKYTAELLDTAVPTLIRAEDANKIKSVKYLNRIHYSEVEINKFLSLYFGE